MMVGDGGRLVGASARGVYIRTAGLFCGRRPKGKVQRPADDDQRGRCNGLRTTTKGEGATACCRGDHVSHLSRNRILNQKQKQIMPLYLNQSRLISVVEVRNSLAVTPPLGSRALRPDSMAFSYT
ncbi:unnamed protein product [Sphagnum jensenii]|uniref:Uncharacterized protein n=1 Tax=Sphagnum jensenii TaxID=128206 RepID=A0ABP1B227_9BRYO